MKKIFISFYFVLIISNLNAQVLNVPQVIQEQNQWCWAGVSKSVLEYYGISKTQCEIADYARQEITWHNFGTVDCCTDPNSGCNYWNYNWGNPGSIQDILIHFGNVQSSGIYNALSLSQINQEITSGHPFIIRWGWYSGGGHFVVGHGVNGNDVYYMNPWFGEGLHISTYNWLIDDGNHTWTSTNKITTTLSNEEINFEDVNLNIFPNPSENNLNIQASFKIEKLKIFNLNGQVIFSNSFANENVLIDTSRFESGFYFIEISNENNKFVRKFLKK